MIIRKAKESDAKSVSELYGALRDYELSLLKEDLKQIQLNWEPVKTEKKIKGIINSKNSVIFVAEDNGKLAGFITCGISKGIKDAECAFDIFISAGYRNKGIGKELISKMIDYFKAEGCKSVLVNVYSANKGAKKFYKKLGFKLVSETYKTKI